MLFFCYFSVLAVPSIHLFFSCVQILTSSSCLNKITQIPVVLLPLHFDRDIALRIPSCQRSVVIRPFLSNDFMTGLPALPDKDLPLDVSSKSKILHFTFLVIM